MILCWQQPKQLNRTTIMNNKPLDNLKDGDQCKVVGGTHAGKSGTIRDVNTSKTGHITITVEQGNGVRFKTLGKNVEVLRGSK
jgi:ribosomal protein S4E